MKRLPNWRVLLVVAVNDEVTSTAESRARLDLDVAFISCALASSGEEAGRKICSFVP